MLPFLGPATLRDGPSRIADTFLEPLYWYDYGDARWISLGLSFIDDRARLLPLDETLAETYDPYAFIRDAYLQRRQYLVYDGDPPEEPLEEFEDFEDDAGDGASEPPAEGDAPPEPEPSGELEPSAEPEPQPEAESSSG
jgi:phospholipid-binding lipoprotein MlaA